MQATNINPVLSAFVEILSQLGFQNIERKNISLSGSVIQNKGLMVNIGVTGSLKGSIVFNMDDDSVKRFASVMMGGMTVETSPEIQESAISEMSNMVCANTCTKFSLIGIEDLNISPPTLIVGCESQVKLSASSIIVINYTVNNIDLDLCVGLVS
jgi:chemotaxis protein CheX